LTSPVAPPPFLKNRAAAAKERASETAAQKQLTPTAKPPVGKSPAVKPPKATRATAHGSRRESGSFSMRNPIEHGSVFFLKMKFKKEVKCGSLS
jgi:hypothetical protein